MLGNVFSDLGFYNGKIAEIISFSSRLSDAERRDIESYLAIKYGITLDISSSGYTYNGGTSLYDLASYPADILGIGINSEQAFIQTSSISIGASSIAAITNATSLNNGDYLIVGHDNAVITSVGSNLPSTVTERLSRIWGVNETGDVGTTSISFNLTGGGYGAYSLSDFSLILDNDDDFTNGVLNIIGAASFDGTTLSFSNIDFTGSANFTIGTGRNLASDSDSDGIPDYFEIAYGTDPSNEDLPITNGGDDDNVDSITPNLGINDTGINGDGISDGLERILIDNGAIGPISKNTDTDGDGIPDWLEVTDGTNPFDGDQPTLAGSNDSDSDGIPDGFENYITANGGAADPDLSTDTDGDGIPDYYEVLNQTLPNDINSPTSNGGNDADGDGISDALESALIAGGAEAPIEVSTDTDLDGIPDHIETITNTDPFDMNSPGIPSAVVSIRALQADYQVSGGNCPDFSGYQWIHVTDQNGNLVYSINPVGNDLGTTCWAIRVLSGESKVRSQTGDFGQEDYILNRNWWITPSIQPSSEVYLRFYSLNTEPSDLRNKTVLDGYDPNVLDEFEADSIHFTKISGIDDLNPFVEGGTRSNHQPMVADAGTLGKSFTFGITSFSSFVAHYSPSNNDVALPIELAFFVGESQKDQVLLKWKTHTEINNEKFIIERSKDGVSFNSLSEISGSGDSSKPLNYAFVDESPMPGFNYYRLTQVDFDGETSQSPTILVDATYSELNWVVYPNPSKDYVKINVDQQSIFQTLFELKLTDMMGKIYPIESYVFNQELVIPINHLTQGRYFLKLTAQDIEKSFSILIE